MGTTIELVAVAPAGSDETYRTRLEQLLDTATDWLHQVEARLSRFLPQSELSGLGRAAGRPCLVSPLTLDAVRTALQAARETDGLYDPTVLPCVLAAGYAVSLPDLLAGPRPASSPPVNWRPGWRDVVIDPWRQLVTLPPGAALDLGGIAKGWAADRICDWWPAEAPLVVNVGGDLRIRLPRGYDGGWPVAVADPFDPTLDLVGLSLPAGGVATSSTVGRSWQTHQGLQHHIIDPRTGAPANSDLVQVTVIAPSAATAEAWAKAVCILGSESGADFLARRPVAAALMVRRDGTCLATPNLEVYLGGPAHVDQEAGD
jgi:thiamine biosynthesis lipoprotein